MLVELLKGKRIAIWGFGREGTSSYLYLRKHFPTCRVTIITETPIEQEFRKVILQDYAVQVVESQKIVAADLKEFDIVIKSPGITPYQESIRVARDHGTVFTSALNIWFANNPGRHVIAVTGSKGKSTTTTLIGRGLRGCGLNVRIGGNIGIPALSLDDCPSDFDVLEVSSYQATDLVGSPEVALLVDLFPEHLDWHGSTDAYFRDKLRVLQLAQKRIFNANDENSRRYALDFANVKTYNSSNGFYPRGKMVMYQNQEIGIIENEYLARDHNMSNICGALTVVELVGGNPKRALSAISTFRGLPHRQQLLGEKSGVLYVNDSISTIPESTLAALDAWKDRDTTLLIGGQDRGIDYSKLIDGIFSRRVRRVILLPKSGLRLGDALKSHHRFKGGNLNTWVVESLEEATLLAEQVTPFGGLILLSPAAPSYGDFRNYEERGIKFAEFAGLLLPDAGL